MAKYEVMLYPKAYRDIDDIYAYIALEKQSPENAKVCSAHVHSDQIRG